MVFGSSISAGQAARGQPDHRFATIAATLLRRHVFPESAWVTEIRLPHPSSSVASANRSRVNLGDPPPPPSQRAPVRSTPANRPSPQQMMPAVLAAARALRVPPGWAFGPPLPRPATARDGRLRGRATPGHRLPARAAGWGTRRFTGVRLPRSERCAVAGDQPRMARDTAAWPPAWHHPKAA
jgi:hypothetical protein